MLLLSVEIILLLLDIILTNSQNTAVHVVHTEDFHCTDLSNASLALCLLLASNLGSLKSIVKSLVDAGLVITFLCGWFVLSSGTENLSRF